MSVDEFYGPTVEADSGATPSEVESNPGGESSIESERLRGSLKSKLFGGDAGSVRIGRFDLRRRLGAGGMGVVYLAHDADLSREVAIKLLKSDTSGDENVARSRLFREAQAMAQLSHPNVIPVFEVGTHEGSVFVAMEYVPGPTLGAWLKESPRSWQEILAMFAQAGEGLAAAHARGLIHRDFKPDNAIVGDDGRVRVMDFGLARPGGGESAEDGEVHDEENLDANMLETPLTRVGAVLGTPAYMAPEQHLGQATDARSDEFSFCVSLFQALYGRRPFAGSTYRELRNNVTWGEPLAPLEMRGPSELLRIIQRGLARDPAKRWPDMSALLAALETVSSAPQRRRRNLVVGAFAALTLATGAWAAVGMGSAATQDAVCVPAAERFAEVWNDEKREEIAQVYASASRRAQQWWTFESSLLDDWSEQWTRIYEKSCDEESETDLTRFALRQSCLDQRMMEIETRVRLLETLEPDARAAAGSGDYLPFYLPRDCENEALVSAVTLFPSDPIEREAAVDAMLDLRVAEGRSQAAWFGGQPDAILHARDAWQRAADTVKANGFKPNIAEVLLRESNGNLVAGSKIDESFETLDEAIAAAAESRNELVRVFGEVWKLWHAANMDRLNRTTDEILRDLEELERDLVAIGSPTYAMAEVLKFQAQFALDTPNADTEKVLDPCARSIDVAREGFGDDSVFTARILHQCSDLLAIAGLDDQANAMRQRAIETTDAALGPDSINLNFILGSEVAHRLRNDDVAEAASAAEHHVRVMRAHHDPGDATMLATVLELAQVRMAQGKYVEANELIESVAPHTSDFTGVYGDVWVRTRMVYLAIAGTPAENRRDATIPEAFPSAVELHKALKPIIEELEPPDAERELAAIVEELHWPEARAATLIQLGRVREELGQSVDAKKAYEAALQIDSTPDQLGAGNLQPALRYAAQQGLARTDP